MRFRALMVVGIVFTALAHPVPSDAARCQSGISVSSGLHCDCPDFAALLADPTSHVDCPPGWTPVIYNVDSTTPFAGDGSTSYATMTGAPGTLCDGVEHTSTISGQVVACWAPPDRKGCRRVKMADDGACFRIDEVPTSPSTSVGLVTVANAGASLRVCPPIDSTVSCRGTKTGGKDENPRFWWGGFCATSGCTGTTIDTNACNASWGATYFGFRMPDGSTTPNWYDWSTGQWKIFSNGSHFNCGPVFDCMGKRRRSYTIQAILVPAPGYNPPCLGPGSTCGPGVCFP